MPARCAKITPARCGAPPAPPGRRRCRRVGHQRVLGTNIHQPVVRPVLPDQRKPGELPMPRQVRKMVRAGHDARSHAIRDQVDDVPGCRRRDRTPAGLRWRSVRRGRHRTCGCQRFEEETSRLHRNGGKDIRNHIQFRKENSRPSMAKPWPAGEFVGCPGTACARHVCSGDKKARQALACRAMDDHFRSGFSGSGRSAGRDPRPLRRG